MTKKKVLGQLHMHAYSTQRFICVRFDLHYLRSYTPTTLTHKRHVLDVLGVAHMYLINVNQNVRI